MNEQNEKIKAYIRANPSEPHWKIASIFNVTPYYICMMGIEIRSEDAKSFVVETPKKQTKTGLI